MVLLYFVHRISKRKRQVITNATYYVSQVGFDGVHCNSAIEVVRYLCDLFGWRFDEKYKHLLPQIEKIQKGCRIKHPDLSLIIDRI